MWDPADVAKILEAVDRGNPCGKRDYAIILLITRLGLRGVDVKRLEFADFDWPGNRLSVAQAKTGHRVQLPLLKDVGWAVIDYVRVWPAGQRLPAGVRAAHRPDRPVLRPGPSASDPGQARPGGARPGQRETPPRHALARHTLATRLMEDGTPVEQIADILGHQSVESTGVYLKSSLGLLAKCALDPDAAARAQASR